MTEKVIEMAKEAGIEWDCASNCSEYRVEFEELQAFAQLIRNEAMEEAINACKEYAELPKVDSGVPLAIANKIGLLK